MTTLLIAVHVLVSLFLIGIVLLQHGKGADVGATFGGSSQSLFGSEGPVPLLNKITTFSAIIFMGTSISLAYLSAHKGTGSVMSELPIQQAAEPKQEAPLTIPMPRTGPEKKKQIEETETAPATQDTASVMQQNEIAVKEEAEPIATEKPINESAEPEIPPMDQQMAPVAQEAESATD